MKLPENKLNTFAQIRELSAAKDKVLSCALLQRMLPNYELFHEVSGFGDTQLTKSVLNLVWEWCMSPKSKFNASVQLEKLEEHIPDVDNFDTFGVYPALDFCMGLSVLLQSINNEHDCPAVTIAKLSQGSVEAFIMATHTEDEALSNHQIKHHPLMQYEIETQISLLDFCQSNKLNKELIKTLRSDIIAQGMSNLGLDNT